MIPIKVRVLKNNWLVDVSALTAPQEARGPRILILEVSSNHVPQPQNQEEKGHERYSRSCEYKVRESSLLPSNYIKLRNGPTRKPFLARDHTIFLFSFRPFFLIYNCCCRRGCYCRCCCWMALRTGSAAPDTHSHSTPLRIFEFTKQTY